MGIFILSTIMILRNIILRRISQRIYATGNAILIPFYVLNIALNIHAAFNCWTLATDLISIFSDCMMMYSVTLLIAAEVIQNKP